MDNTDLSSTSLATWVFAIHRTLTDLGHDADKVMKSAGFDFSSINSTTQRIPKDQLNAIWRSAEEVTNDDAFCVSTFPHLNDPYLNALITSAQSSSSVQHAIRLLLKYYHVVTSSSKLSVRLTNHVELHVEPVDHDSPVSPQDVDLVFGLVTKYGSVLPVKEIRPVILYLSRLRPKNAAAYQKHFGCPIIFEADNDELHYSIEILNAEIPSANPVLSNHVEQYLAEQTSESDRKDSNEDIQKRVEQAVTNLLSQGTPKLKNVAITLNTSVRTLQRKLQQENLSYKDLLNKVRVDLAKEYLRDSKDSIQTISYKLGFTEPGNFIRFFKSQTELTPNQFAKSRTL